eukprot:SAG31_NODE_206_length_20335_cov_17.910160_4_plen_1120_part_00
MAYFVRKLAQRSSAGADGDATAMSSTELSAVLDAMFAMATTPDRLDTAAAPEPAMRSSSSHDSSGDTHVESAELAYRRQVQTIKFMKKPAVVKELRQRGLDTRGKYAALKARLLRAVASENRGSGQRADQQLAEEDVETSSNAASGDAPAAVDFETHLRARTQLSYSDTLQDGFASIMFEAVKGVGHGLHSTTDFVLALLFMKLDPAFRLSGGIQPYEMQTRRTIVSMLLHKICDHVRSDSSSSGGDEGGHPRLRAAARRVPGSDAGVHCERIWALLHNQIEVATRTWAPAQDAELRLEMVLDIMTEWIARRLLRSKDQSSKGDGGDDSPSNDAGDTEQLIEVNQDSAARQRRERRDRKRDEKVVKRVWSSLRLVMALSVSNAVASGSTATAPVSDLVSTALFRTMMQLLKTASRMPQQEAQCQQVLGSSSFLAALFGDGSCDAQHTFSQASVYAFVQDLADNWKEGFTAVAARLIPAATAHVERICAQNDKHTLDKAAAIKLLVDVAEACPLQVRVANANGAPGHRLPTGARTAHWILDKLGHIGTGNDLRDQQLSTPFQWLLLRGLEIIDLQPDNQVEAAMRLILALWEPTKSKMLAQTETSLGLVADEQSTVGAACLQTLGSLGRDYRQATGISSISIFPRLLQDAFELCQRVVGVSSAVILHATINCVNFAVEAQNGSGEHVMAALNEGTVRALSKLLSSSVPTVRKRAAVLLHTCSQTGANGGTKLHAAEQMLATMVAVNETPHTVASGREACVKLTRLSQMVRRIKCTGAADEWVFPHFLSGVLKTKFSVLWPTAIEVFVEDAGSRFDTIWPMLLAEIRELQARSGDVNFMLHRTKASAKETAVQAAESIIAVSTQHEETSTSAEISFNTRIQNEFLLWRTSEDRLTDYSSYHESMWSILAQLPDTFRKNREIVPLFLDFITQYHALWNDEAERQANSADESKSPKKTADTGDGSNMLGVTKKLMNSALRDYLKLFETFKGAGFMHNADAVRECLERLLTKAEPDIQKLSLNCLLPFRKKQLSLYMPILNEMIDEKSFREAITEFRLTDDASEADVSLSGKTGEKITRLQPEHREVVVPILIRILYGKLMNRRGRGKQTLATRRAAVMVRCLL